MTFKSKNNILNLIEVLEKLSQAINLGYELAKRKTEILRMNDLAALKLATKEEETIASHIAELEKQRLALQAEAGESAKTTISLCESVDANLKNRAEKVIQELTQNARLLEIQTTINQEITQHLLQYTKHDLSQLVQACPAPTYGQSGTDATISRSALDRKA
jgi:ribosomal protein L16 Arg81 hydroxylase